MVRLEPLVEEHREPLRSVAMHPEIWQWMDRRVTETDYQPVDYDGYRFQAFGVFTTDRTNYDRNYGIVDGKWYRFASRYNIWERSHYYAKDAMGMTDPVACATKASPSASIPIARSGLWRC